MKADMDPKTVGIVIGVVVLVLVIGGYFLIGRGTGGDRSGQLINVDLHSPSGLKPPSGTMPPGFTPGKVAPPGTGTMGRPLATD